MRKLLLVSSSATHDTDYLDHCEAQILELFRETGVTSVLFVPFALADWDAYATKAKSRFRRMGLELVSIHSTANQVKAIEEARGFFIGGGNTFRLLKSLYDHRLIEPIQDRVSSGFPYLGTSAGSNVACPTIMTTNDMPIVYPPSFDALNLVPIQINAHYLDADPNSTHMGETREARLREYHEENPTPVMGLREGAMLSVRDSAVVLLGRSGGKLFRRGQDPIECPPGTRFNQLLDLEASC